MFGIDWDGDGDVDEKDDMIDLFILDDLEEEERQDEKKSGGGCLTAFLIFLIMPSTTIGMGIWFFIRMI